MTDDELALTVAVRVAVIVKWHRWLERHEVRPSGPEARIAGLAACQAAARIGIPWPAVRFFAGDRRSAIGVYDQAAGCLWLHSGQPTAELVDTVWHELAHRGQQVARVRIGHGKRFSPAAFAAHDPKVARRLARAVARRSGRKGN